MKTKRSLSLVVRVLFLLPLVMLAFTTVYPQSASWSQTKSPIKIGWIGCLSGPIAEGAIAMLRGTKLAFKEANWEVAGRKIEMSVEDDMLNPGVTLSKVKKYLFSDKINLLIGPYTGSSGLAIIDFIDANKLVTVSGQAALATLTQEKFTPYFFRTSFNDAGQATPFEGWLAYHMGHRNVACISIDSAYGHACLDGFKRIFTKVGGNVTQEIYVPQGTAIDLSPYLAKIDTSKIDLVYSWLTGSDALRFVKQYSEYGYKEMPLFGANMIGETYLPELRDAALGIQGVLHYVQSLPNQENQKFLKIYENEYGSELTKKIAAFDVQGYECGKLILMGLEAVNGKVEDSSALIKALEKVQFESPRGPFKLDDHHNPVYLEYLFRVEKVGGKYQNTVLKAYGPIYQGWFEAGFQPPEVPVPGKK